MTPRAELRDAIFRSGKPQIEIARRTGIDETKLSKIVRGWRDPSPKEVRALSRVLRVPASQLFPEPSPSESSPSEAVTR